MSNIVLTPDQLQVVNQSPGPVVVVDPDGKVMGQVARRWFSADAIAAAERRAGDKTDPVVPADDVIKRLRSMGQ